MILVDRREKPHKHEKTELLSLIRRYGVAAETADLPFGDFAFDGAGGLSVGIERKRVHDMLQCVEDARFAAHQRLGMKRLYQESWLLLEGVWRNHDERGTLMEGDGRGGWWESKPGGNRVLYSKLRRYLFSVERVGVPIIYTRDMAQTAYDVVELYHYYAKRDHTSMLEKQKLAIPSLTGKPTLLRRWAMELDGVGVKKLDEVATLFPTPRALANADPIEWLAVPGVGMKTAESIVNEITGGK